MLLKSSNGSVLNTVKRLRRLLWVLDRAFCVVVLACAFGVIGLLAEGIIFHNVHVHFWYMTTGYWIVATIGLVFGIYYVYLTRDEEILLLRMIWY